MKICSNQVKLNIIWIIIRTKPIFQWANEQYIKNDVVVTVDIVMEGGWIWANRNSFI
jgi:hypothetical protein